MIFSIPVYQLYLLQIENYEIFRYWSLLFQKGYFLSKQPLRKSIVWTQKVLGIFLLAIFLYSGIGILIALSSPMIHTGMYAVVGFLLFPVFYTIALVILSPGDYVLKQWYIRKAKHILASAKHIKIIAVAGSYGKTTMKNVLSSVLSTTFNVITTPESVNTPIGIAQWLLKYFKQDTEIVIVEMGEHYRGDIAYLCSVMPPDIAVLTGINEAHLERLQTVDTSIATLFEVVEHAKEDAHIILNADDSYVRNNYKTYKDKKQVSFYSFKNDLLSELTITKKSFNTDHLYWSCEIESFGKVNVPLLGEYGIGDVVASILIGKVLGLHTNALKKGIAAISPVPHRLEPIHGAGGALVIDDSYNGNPDGVHEAIHVLSLFKKRRKIFITPGLVEMGGKVQSVHEAIGSALADVADLVILIRNSVTPYIEKGLKKEKLDESHIIWFNTASEAYAALSGIVKENDVILFQNDWGDQYV